MGKSLLSHGDLKKKSNERQRGVSEEIIQASMISLTLHPALRNNTSEFSCVFKHFVILIMQV